MAYCLLSAKVPLKANNLRYIMIITSVVESDIQKQFLMKGTILDPHGEKDIFKLPVGLCICRNLIRKLKAIRDGELSLNLYLRM